MNLACREPMMVVEIGQDGVQETVGVTAVWIKQADAAPAGDVLEDRIQKTGTLARPGGTDGMQMLQSWRIADAYLATVVIDTEHDAIGGHRSARRRCTDEGPRWRRWRAPGGEFGPAFGKDLFWCLAAHETALQFLTIGRLRALGSQAREECVERIQLFITGLTCAG